MPNIHSTHRFWEDLPYFYNSASYYDVVFHCMGGHLLKAHRVVLSSWSSLLQLLFEEQSQRDVVEVSLPDIDVQCLDNILRFLYEGSIRMNENELKEFFKCREALSLKFTYVCVNDEGEEVCMVHDEKLPEQTPERISVIKDINTMLENFSNVPTPHKNQNQGQNKKVLPVLVPLKHYQTAVQIVERKRAEKNLETLVEQKIQTRMKFILKEMKEERKKRSNRKENGNHDGQLLQNPLVKSLPYQLPVKPYEYPQGNSSKPLKTYPSPLKNSSRSVKTYKSSLENSSSSAKK